MPNRAVVELDYAEIDASKSYTPQFVWDTPYYALRGVIPGNQDRVFCIGRDRCKRFLIEITGVGVGEGGDPSAQP